MAKINLLNLEGNIVKAIEVADNLFLEQPHKQAIFDCIISENAAERQGTHSTLTKGEVRGGGKKPWRQKHTGRARTGSIRNPQWTGGGVVFGPKPNRNYTKKVNRKVFRLGLQSALTSKYQLENLFALDQNTSLEKPSTKLIANFVKNANLHEKKVLVVLDENTQSVNLLKSTNNLTKVVAKLWNNVSVRDIVNANVVVLSENVFSKYEEVWA